MNQETEESSHTPTDRVTPRKVETTRSVNTETGSRIKSVLTEGTRGPFLRNDFRFHEDRTSLCSVGRTCTTDVCI